MARGQRERSEKQEAPLPAASAARAEVKPPAVTAAPVVTMTPERAARRRHWQERFDPKAPYLWARSRLHNGVKTVAGQPVDASTMRRGQLRLLWNAGAVRRADFTARPKSTLHLRTT